MNNEGKKIFIFDAEPGMELFEDVLTPDGSLVAAAEVILNLDIIAKISDYHILEIKVVDKPAEADKVIHEESTYFEKVRSSAQFVEFKQEYDTGIDDLKNQLNDIIKNNSEIDTDALLDHTLHIMEKTPNRLQMFDMLHSLRQFDDSTYAHSFNVALVSSIIAQWLNFPEEDIKLITIAGLLHDIGKINIPKEIINKPGKLTAVEFEVVKNHVNFGFELIKNKGLDPRICETVLLHHEKCNGKGYPFGLTGDRIPVFAKIVSIADIYDAMTATRSYRSAVCPFRVIRMLEQECFSALDPKYTLPFLKNVVSSYIHNTIKLSDGRIGEVILINDRDLSRPVIKCEDTFIDLTKTPDLSIVAIM